MESRPPVLTVITPVLNGASRLPRCLESVARLAADLGGGIEHIVADGGSGDGSLEIAREALASAASPVGLVLEGPDLGQSHAINRGLAEANGIWVTWLNADDWFEPGAAEAVRELAAEANGGVDWVVARCRFVDARGATIFSPTPPKLDSLDGFLRPLSGWFAGRCIVQPEAFVRRDALVRVGGLDIKNHYAMDHDLWLRLIESGCVGRSIDRLVATQYVHEGQKTADNERVARAILDNCERCLSRMGAAPDPVAAGELDELRSRLSAFGRAMSASSKRDPIDRFAAAADMTELAGRVRNRRGVALAVGPQAVAALRVNGWRSNETVLAQRVPPVAGAFAAAVVDCDAARLNQDSFIALCNAVRPGGHIVLGGCSFTGSLEQASHGLRSSLAARLTVRRQPWDAETLSIASETLAWIRSVHPVGEELLSGVELLTRMPCRLHPTVAAALRALDIGTLELGASLLIRNSNDSTRIR